MPASPFRRLLTGLGLPAAFCPPSSTFPFAGIVRSDGSSWETVARGRKEHLVAGRTQKAAAGREWAVIPLACDPMVVERTDYEWRE